MKSILKKPRYRLLVKKYDDNDDDSVNWNSKSSTVTAKTKGTTTPFSKGINAMYNLDLCWPAYDCWIY